MVKLPALAVPQLAPCASSGRAWRLWAAQYSQSEAQPLGAPPLPRGLKRAASKVADFTAFGHLGMGVTVKTEVEGAAKFWDAEDYHQQYLQKNGQDASKDAEETIRCYG